jgi:hypothetical protein
MARKKSQVKAAAPQALKVSSGEHGHTEKMTQSQLYAALSVRSYLMAHTMRDYCGFDKKILEVEDMYIELEKAGSEVVRGDLSRIEYALTNQFLTLDAIFGNLAERSQRQQYINQADTYLRLALKAQAQARATAEALALLKNPMPYIKQANIAQGHQQVNNMYASTSAHTGKASHAEKSASAPNKLLENQEVAAPAGAEISCVVPSKLMDKVPV